MADVKFEAVDKKNLDKYRQVILGDIYSEIMDCPDPEDEGYLVIGAFTEELVAGAVCAVLDDVTGDIQLISIYVPMELRRNKIATSLIQRLFLAAGESYNTEVSAPVNLFCVYSLEHEDEILFEAFLSSLGNCQIDDMPVIFPVDSKDLESSSMFKAVFEKGDDTLEDEGFFSGEGFHERFWEGLCLSLDAYPDREYSFFWGDRLSPDGMVLIEREAAGEYRVIALNMSEDIPKRTFERLVIFAFKNIADREPGGFTLFLEEADEESGEEEYLWVYRELVSLSREELRARIAVVKLLLSSIIG